MGNRFVQVNGLLHLLHSFSVQKYEVSGIFQGSDTLVNDIVPISNVCVQRYPFFVKLPGTNASGADSLFTKSLKCRDLLCITRKRNVLTSTFRGWEH